MAVVLGDPRESEEKEVQKSVEFVYVLQAGAGVCVAVGLCCAWHAWTSLLFPVIPHAANERRYVGSLR